MVGSSRLLSALQRLDYKLLLVPVAFILLRMWSFAGDILFVYIGVRHIESKSLAQIFMTLEVLACEILCMYMYVYSV